MRYINFSSSSVEQPIPEVLSCFPEKQEILPWPHKGPGLTASSTDFLPVPCFLSRLHPCLQKYLVLIMTELFRGPIAQNDLPPGLCPSLHTLYLPPPSQANIQLCLVCSVHGHLSSAFLLLQLYGHLILNEHIEKMGDICLHTHTRVYWNITQP